jgi:hypothetical protein
VIIRDEKGLVIAALSRTIFSKFDPQMAEATATLQAMELCRDIGVQDLFLERDALTIVGASTFNNYVGRNG